MQKNRGDKSPPCNCSLKLQLHGAIYRPDSFVLMLRYCANLKAIRYESTSLNRIVADKSHRVIAALHIAICLTFFCVHDRSLCKGPVKLIKRVKIALSFLQSVSDQFHIIILSFPMYFYKWVSKNFSKPTSINGETCRFNRSVLKESFQLTLKCHQFIPFNMKHTC